MRGSRVTGGFLSDRQPGVISRGGGSLAPLEGVSRHRVSLGVPLQPVPGQEEPVSPRGWGRPGCCDSFRDSVFVFLRVAPRSCCSGPGVGPCPPQGTTVPCRGPREIPGALRSPPGVLAGLQ